MKTNVTLKQQQKELAISLMKKLDIYEPYIDVFEKEDVVSYFERYIGFWAYQDKELDEKVKELEKEYGCRVYAITHEFTDFGECYSFLIVSKYKEEWERSIVTEEARKLSAKGATSACVKDEIVFGWAMHYFEENEIIGKLFNEDGLDKKPISEIRVRDVQLFLNSFEKGYVKGKPLAKLIRPLPERVNFRELARDNILSRVSSYKKFYFIIISSPKISSNVQSAVCSKAFADERISSKSSSGSSLFSYTLGSLSCSIGGSFTIVSGSV